MRGHCTGHRLALSALAITVFILIAPRRECEKGLVRSYGRSFCEGQKFTRQRRPVQEVPAIEFEDTVLPSTEGTAKASERTNEKATNDLKNQRPANKPDFGKQDFSPVGRQSLPARVGLHSDKWIVITTVQLPTDAVRTMAAQKGWSVVAVGDKKTPSNWQLDNCVFLSVEQQADLGFKIHDYIPYKHYGRKNIGYLYAIKHGAKLIYDTDDDNELIVDDLNDAFLLDLSGASVSERNMLVFGHQKRYMSVVNPYVHFGQPNLWPRGYPLGAVTSLRKNRYRAASSNLKPYVQQGLANGDPDVDAIFRVTRKRGGAKIDLTFDRDAPPVALAPGQISPYNTQNTLIHKEAFWGLLVPVTTTFRVCDIWRGYWVQRVLWEIGGSLSFHPPSVYQDRNEHDYFLDHVDEFPLYNDSTSFVQFLLNWEPPVGNLFVKIRHLAHAMAEHGFWKAGDAQLMDAWLTDLEAVGYSPPAVLDKKNSDEAVLGAKEYTPRSLPSTYMYMTS